MRKSVLLFLVFLPCFLFSQQWHAYSDSIISNIKKNDYTRADNFIDLADSNIGKSTLLKDTLYADYLYRKGVVKYELGKFDNAIFDESLSVWEYGKKMNYSKIAKIHYFLGAGYYLKLDYIKAYEHFQKCYSINKKNKLPWNYNFSLTINYLSLIDYNTNKDFKKAKQYAQEYIEYNKNIALSNYDFNYVSSFRRMDDLKGYENVLLEFNKSYNEKKLNNLKLYFQINYELFKCYRLIENTKEIIKYGENSVELYQASNKNDEKYLAELYSVLAWAYAEINDEINSDKYAKLNDKYSNNSKTPKYLVDLDKLFRNEDAIGFKNKFEESEAILKLQKDYNALVELYNLFLIPKLGQSVIFFKDENILYRIDLIKSNYDSLSKDNQSNINRIAADSYKNLGQFNKALKLSNQNLTVKDFEQKMAFYRIKATCEDRLGNNESAKKTSYDAYKIAAEKYGDNDPRLLPFLESILEMNHVGNNLISNEIAIKVLKVLNDNKLTDSKSTILTWYLLGTQAYFNRNFIDAKKYFEKSIHIQDNSDIIEWQDTYYQCIKNIMYIMIKTDNFDELEIYSNKLLLFLKYNPNPEKELLGDLKIFLGDVNFFRLKFEDANINYEEGFAILGENKSKKHKFDYILSKYFVNNNIPETINELEKFQKYNSESNHVSNIIYLLKYNSGNMKSAQNHLVNQLNKLISENNQYFHLLSDYEKEILFKGFIEQFEFLNSYLLNKDINFLNQYINFRFYSKFLLFSNAFKANADIENEKELYVELKNNTTQINMNFESKSEEAKSIEDLRIRNREIEKLLAVNSKLLSTPTVKDLNTKLKNDEAYIEIIRINNQSKIKKSGTEILNIFTDSISYGAIVIKKNSTPKFVLIDGCNNLEKQYASNFKSKIINKQEDNESYHLLFEKIDDELKDVKNIYLVTDGIYNFINIESLYNPNRKQYLIDYLKIQPIQNVRAITDNKKDFKVSLSTKTILFGNPDFDLLIANKKENEFSLERGLDNELLDEIKSGVKISPLNGTQKEIETLDAILNNSNSIVELFSKANATEDNLKKIQSPDILHIATHGYFLSNDDTSKTKQSIANLFNESYKNDSYLKSGLLLAGAQNTLNGKQPESKNNGILTAEEAKSLNLKDTELVVLSACETGLGDNLVGEGVIGLQRAFMIAGAKSVIMSLWSVSDEKTQELMTMFYTNWIKNKMTKEEALYQAKIEMKKLYPQPYYWAGFVLLE
jgi:CHAT domain-containing protein